MTKFIPLSFLLALIVFIMKQAQENEFVILWTSGVKKLKLANLFVVISIFVLIFYIIFSIFVSPFALNKSRYLLNKDGFNSFLPTIRAKQFSDSFDQFTFLVDKKINNEIQNVFIYDSSNTLKNLTSDNSKQSTTTIIAKEGIVEEKQLILFNGHIITSNKETLKNNMIKFDQINIDLKNLQTGVVKKLKLQEISTYKLLSCFKNRVTSEFNNCENNKKEEIITVLNRRIVLPFYLPIISLLCSFLLIKSKGKKKIFLNKYTIFSITFIILLYAEMIIRFTGMSKAISLLFISTPLILIPIIYFILNLKLSRESYFR